jgi:DNA replication protein DnaC
MSDDETPPARDMTALRANWQRIREDADNALAARERADAAETLVAIRETAERSIAAMSVLPCRGAIKNIPACSTDFAAKCERRESPSCPRQMVELDRRQAAEEQRERFLRAKVPDRVRRALLENFYATPETNAVDEWLASRKALMLLAGPPGTGKSVAAGYALMRRGGVWAHVSEIADVYGLDRAAVVARLKAARFLVLDDLGSEQKSEGARDAVVSVLLVRFENEQATVMTSNLSPDAWKLYADERIRDRLAGDGMVYGSSGPSRRRA